MPAPTGRTVVTMPTSPIGPAGLEFQDNAIAGLVTNPFTGQVQVYDWAADYFEASYSLPPLTSTQGQLWAAFIMSCKGPVCVFTFPSAVCTQFPNECTSDGTNARYWQLKGNPKWTIKNGAIYGLTFECREVK